MERGEERMDAPMDAKGDAPALTLTLTGPRGLPPRIYRLGVAGGWIGRGRDCEVPIDDPDRFVSLKHARIDRAGGQFWITDQSSNGTFLNGAAAPLANGRRHPLTNGDRIRVGLFDLGVAVDQGEAAETPGGSRQAGLSHLDPLLEFAREPLAARPGAPLHAPPLPLREPDPLAALLSDLAGTVAGGGPPAAEPGGEPAPEPARLFVGSASAHAAREPALPAFPTTAEPSDSVPPVPVPAPIPTSVPTSVPGAAAVKTTGGTMLAAMAAEIADLTPALRPAEPPAPPTPAEPVWEPERGKAPARPVDPATAALAAFWCGLGIIPRQLDPSDLVDVMAELGVALREAAEGLSGLLGRAGGDGETDRNPFGSGHGGLRRYLEARPAGGVRLDEAVRAAFARNEQRRLAYRAAVRAGVARMAQSLSASAIERRFGEVLQARFPRARQAELWRLFRAMEKEFAELAEAQFQNEVEQQLRGERLLQGRNESGRLAS